MRRNEYTVTQINSYIRNMFSEDYLLSGVFVRGEISNLKYHSSGHIYLSLKDEKSLLKCVCFRAQAASIPFKLEDGMSVTAFGRIEVFERDGAYQLYISKIEKQGMGELAEKFEKLKNELEERGMFAPEYKQAIPFFTHTLGVVTAPTGAAIRDIINVSKRRNPYINIILYPAIVQGENAVPSIVEGIRALEAIGVDVMIVGRGGGSIEDLWAFNEEAVAQAIFDCSVPVISAVGHETDTTISDFVADLRAPTPSAAAERAVCDIEKIIASVRGYRERLDFALRSSVSAYRIKEESKRRLLNLKMEHLLSEKRHELEGLSVKLDSCSPESRFKLEKERFKTYGEKLEISFLKLLNEKKHEVKLYMERIKALSPHERLAGGYGFLRDDSGKKIKSIADVKIGDLIKIDLKDGALSAEVKETAQREG
ncbi:MAG: exodeoxyribonuclease VII large subunit [Lachnospiraceae bacterium]|nr:exodeoxyribonuclease VII large subunit [Lachnospiraceae bacterium]